MCCYCLKKNLPNDHDVRLSNWCARHLTSAQCRYAALDAYASYLIYQKLISSSDPRFNPPPTSLEPGSGVLLFTKSNAFCVASGTICEEQPTKFGVYSLSTKSCKRVVVTLDKNSVFIPEATSMYPLHGKKGERILSLGECADLGEQQRLLLWDMDNIRLETEGALRWVDSTDHCVLHDILNYGAFGDADDNDDGFFTAVGEESGLGVTGMIPDVGARDKDDEPDEETDADDDEDARFWDTFDDPDCERDVQEWFGKYFIIFMNNLLIPKVGLGHSRHLLLHHDCY
jgi:hypothetical protein